LKIYTKTRVSQMVTRTVPRPRTRSVPDWYLIVAIGSSVNSSRPSVDIVISYMVSKSIYLKRIAEAIAIVEASNDNNDEE
jgi:hypothetical protein